MTGGDSSKKLKSDDIFQKMMDTASEYHLHFSTVRTTATSLVLPIGLLSSINLVANWTLFGRLFLLFFMLFVITTVLFLNIIFSGWSHACRRIERYYEKIMDKEEPFNYELHGFRHVFRIITRLPISGTTRASVNSTLEDLKSKEPNFPERINWYDPRFMKDPFIAAVIIFGVLYLLAYFIVLCRLG